MVWVDSLSMCGFKWIFGQMDGWCLGSLGDVDGDGYCARFGVRLRRREDWGWGLHSRLRGRIGSVDGYEIVYAGQEDVCVNGMSLVCVENRLSPTL